MTHAHAHNHLAYMKLQQTVWQIKSGANWVDHHNPFAGLMRGAA